MTYNGKKLRNVGSGVECRVYAFGRGRVLKLYSGLGKRDRAYARQRKAFKAGFGPPVYGKIDLGKGNRGYISHRVRTGMEVPSYEFSTEAYEALERFAMEQGWQADDLHEQNIGIYEGRLVIIDFGDLSLTYEPTVC